MGDTPNQVSADLAALGKATSDRVHKAVVRYTAILQTEVKKRANRPRTEPRPGAPGVGPRFVHGNYNGSISRGVFRSAHRSTGIVGSSAPQARRLELGFFGADSLGRNFHQQPYPHYGPALDQVGPDFEAAVAEAARPGADQ